MNKKFVQFGVIAVLAVALLAVSLLLWPSGNAAEEPSPTPSNTRPTPTAIPTSTDNPVPSTLQPTEIPTLSVTTGPTYQPEGTDTALQSFGFLKADNPTLSEDVWCEIVDGRVIGRLPTGAYGTALIATFEHNAKQLVLPDHRNNDYEKYGSVTVTSGRSKYVYYADDRLRLIYADGHYIDYIVQMSSNTIDAPTFQRIVATQADNPTLPFDAVASSLLDMTVDLNKGRKTGEMVLFLPYVESNSSVVVQFFMKEGHSLTIDGTAVDASAATLTEGQTYQLALTSSAGETKDYTLRLRAVDTKLPMFHIVTETEATITDRENSVYSTVTYYNESGRQVSTFNKAQLRLRGNSSASKPKKNFSLTLYEKQSLFGFPESRDYVLTANYNDKTLMRNAIGFKLASMMDNLLYTPRGEYCELYINGDYWGNYELREKPREDDGRLELNLMTDDNLGGDFMVECDARAEEQDQTFFLSDRAGIMMFVQYPNKQRLTSKQFNAIKQAIADAENGFGTGDASLLDLDSIIDYYLVNEFMHTIDAGMFCSVFVYRKDGKVGMGPVWDFDISTGNCDYNNTSASSTAMQFVDAPWFKYIYRTPAFQTQMENRWKELSSMLNKELMAFIDETREKIELSQQANFERWPIQGVYVWPNYVVLDSYEAEYQYLRNWIISRFSFMDITLK